MFFHELSAKITESTVASEKILKDYEEKDEVKQQIHCSTQNQNEINFTKM